MFSKKLRQSIGFKFLIIVSAILLTGTVVTSTLIAVNERAMLRHSLINMGNGLVSYIAKLSKDPLIMKDNIELDHIVNQANKNEEVLYAVILDASGNPLTSQFASIDYAWPRVKEIVSGLPKDSQLKDIIAAIKRQGGVIEVFTPITSDTDTIGKVTFGLSEHKINQHIVKTIMFIVGLNLVITFILGAILFLASKKLILDPITKLVQATNRLAKGELTTRVKIKTSGEVQRLVESFNLMAEDLGKALVSKENELAERKRAEKARSQAEEKYHSIVEQAVEGIFQSTPAGKFLVANTAVADFFGYDSPQELMAAISDIGDQLYVNLEDRQEYIQLLDTEGVVKGFEIQFYRKDGTKTWGSLNVRAVRDSEGNLIYLEGTVENITLRKGAEEELQKSLGKLRKVTGGIVQALASTVETRDPYTAGHQRRVADLARSIAQEMGLPVDQVDGLRMAGIVHDLGKIGVPAEILSKPTKLSDLEFGLIKVHPQISYDILKDIDFPWPVAEIVLQHHERIDGSGYPRGLKGEKISLEARILMVADVVEAMASHRPYRPALGIDKAFEEIEKNKGILYEAEVVDSCLRLFREKGFKLEVY